MNDKDRALANAIRLLVNAGYEVMYEAAQIGRDGTGVHLHLLDELTPKTIPFQVSYDNEMVKELLGEQK